MSHRISPFIPVVLLAMLAVGTESPAGTVTISSSTTLTSGSASLYASDDVIVTGSGTVLTLSAHPTYGTLVQYSFGSLTVTNGAAVRCLGQNVAPNDANAKGVAIWATTDVRVHAGCNINAVSNGFLNAGPGYPPSAGWSQSTGGAGHGGTGGDSERLAYQVGGRAYGSATQPTTLGSGGLGGGSYGGGAIRIVAGGTVLVDGTVSATAPDMPSNYYWRSGGAGGSVWIDCNTLAGSGAITADGGRPTTPGFSHAGGGGGRIALYMTTDSFAGAVHAYGGAQGYTGDYADYGAAGTIYKKTPSDTNGRLIIDAGSRTPNGREAAGAYLGGTNDTSTYTFDSIQLINSGRLGVQGSETLNISQNTVIGDGSGQLGMVYGKGTIAFPSAYVVSNYWLALNNGSPSGLSSLTITNAGRLTHYANTTNETYKLNLALDSLTVAPGCGVDAVGRGYISCGPGFPADPGYTGAGGGAGHGGTGGDAGWDIYVLGGKAYGSAKQPTTIGSGGGGSGTISSYGGGAIKIVATGAVRVDGTVSATAPDMVLNYYWRSGAAGGSVWIQADTLAGTGSIVADGGRPTAYGWAHGGGGGGRIALYMTTDSFAGSVHAYGGAQGYSPGYRSGYGSAGTIYKKLTAETNGRLIIDAGSRTPTGRDACGAFLGDTNDTATYTFDSIQLINAGRLGVQGSETLNISADTVQSDGSGRLGWVNGQGTLALPGAYVVSNYALALNNGTPAGLTSLTITNIGRLTHYANTTAETYRLDLALDSLSVASNSLVDVSSNGFVCQRGPGLAPNVGNNTSGGAGHGGLGGFSHQNGDLRTVMFRGGQTYGSATQPTNCGSGGHLSNGGADDNFNQNSGGGAVKLAVAGTVQVDGAISANSSRNIAYYDGFGSGGSVWITAQQLAGVGVISADGGYAGSDLASSGGGGGGRIALYLTNNNFSGVVRATGGKPSSEYSGAEWGGAGTIFTKLSSQSYGVLKVDNTNNQTTWAGAMIAGTNDTGSYTFDALQLTGKGRLVIAAGQTLQIQGSPNPDIRSDGSGMLANRGTVLLPATCTISNIALLNDNAASLGSLANLTLCGSGTLGHSMNWSNEDYRLDLALQSLTIQSGASVSADDAGYMMEMGPGASPYIWDGSTISATHAGLGSNNTNMPYGTAVAPTNMGSGGSGRYSLYWDYPLRWMRGGGAIKLKVKNTLTVDGTISAQARYRPSHNAQSGAGGSIWLDVGTIAGTGTVRAIGQQAGPDTVGGAGGGRIAIKYRKATLSNFPAPGLYTNREDVSANVTVRGGYNIGTNGVEDGSIYIEKVVTGSLFMVN